MSSYYQIWDPYKQCLPWGVFDEQMKKKSFYKKLVRNYSKRSPIKRMAFPLEIADPIVYLASISDAYISGSTLIVDGGWTAI